MCLLEMVADSPRGSSIATAGSVSRDHHHHSHHHLESYLDHRHSLSPATARPDVEIEIIGWSMWFSDYVFLERSWAKDENILKTGYQRLEDFPMPFWLALIVEGTCFTQAKLLAAQEYATSAGLLVPRNVLIPLTKGFVTAVCQMQSFVPAIYDITVAIPRSQPPPTMLRMFKGLSSCGCNVGRAS